MRRRSLLALFALALLVLSSGCMGFFAGDISERRLDEPPEKPYAWNASVDAHITVTSDATFRAVYETNKSQLRLYRRDGMGGKSPIPISSVRYRYPNGTTINGSAFDDHGGGIRKNQNVVVVTFPTDGPVNATGQFAFTSQSTPKRFSLPVFVEGSYEVVLPPHRRVKFFLFGNVIPGGYRTTIDAQDRTHIHWDHVETRAIVVQFYHERDLPIFGGFVGVMSLLGVGAVLYYRYRIQKLREKREEMGLDVDTEDDEFGKNPPPGMG